MPKLKLFAPAGYWSLTKEAKAILCNGCGPKNWLAYMIPDNFYGLDVSECCNIHDYSYFIGKVHEDKESADRAFLNNLTRTVTAGTDPDDIELLQKRLELAKVYYNAVKYFGGPAFWKDKNLDVEFQEINTTTKL